MAVELNAEDFPKYTYDDYLIWEGKWELINGMPFAMSPSPIYRHQLICSNIFIQLGILLKKCGICQVLDGLDWKIDDFTVVQPDIIVICDKVTEDFLTFPPTIIFEVLSPSTQKRDRNLKLRLYESQGVKYYVIVDLINNKAEVYNLVDGKYIDKKTLDNDQYTFHLTEQCVIDFDLSEIWD